MKATSATPLVKLPMSGDVSEDGRPLTKSPFAPAGEILRICAPSALPLYGPIGNGTWSGS